MIKMELNKAEFSRIMKALDRLKIGGIPVVNSAMERMAKDMAMELKANILSQRYGSFGFPFDPKYAAYKQSISGRGGEYWIYLGALVGSISHWAVSPGVFRVGIPSTAVNSDGKLIAMYGTTLEQGLNGHKRRPLFMKSFSDFKLEKVPGHMLLLYATVKKLWH